MGESVREKETREQEEMVAGERSGARTEKKKKEVRETVATRRDVKSMASVFGHKMSALWLNGCWLAHVIALIF